jgi:hypothetical protein
MRQRSALPEMTLAAAGQILGFFITSTTLAALLLLAWHSV